jgi:hypothetical protein
VLTVKIVHFVIMMARLLAQGAIFAKETANLRFFEI